MLGLLLGLLPGSQATNQRVTGARSGAAHW
jgi:hypothetical protein